MNSAYPTKPGMPFMQNFADQFFKYFVASDPNAKLPDFDPEHPSRCLKCRSSIAMTTQVARSCPIRVGRTPQPNSSCFGMPGLLAEPG